MVGCALTADEWAALGGGTGSSGRSEEPVSVAVCELVAGRWWLTNASQRDEGRGRGRC